MITLTIRLSGKDAQQALDTINRQGGRILSVDTYAEGGCGEAIIYQLPDGEICCINTILPSFSGVYDKSADPIDNYVASRGELLKALRDAGVPLGHTVEDLVVA